MDYKRQQNLIERISKLGTLHELQRLCSFVSVNLTKRYENQLRQLQTLQEQQAALGIGQQQQQQQKPKWSIRSALKRTKQKTEKVILDKDPKSGSEAMSDYVLALLWDELQNEENPGVSLEKRLIECVTIPPPQKTGVLSALQNLIAEAAAFKMTTISGKVWTFDGALHSCGLRTAMGTFYDGPNGRMDPSMYQYCNSEDAEVHARGLVVCNVPAIGAAPNPKT